MVQNIPEIVNVFLMQETGRFLGRLLCLHTCAYIVVFTQLCLHVMY